jgi:hypothetical protein
MSHLLVDQLHFTRNEFTRCIEGVSAEEATRRFMPMNCISWIVGHLANQENQYWVYLAQGKQLVPGLRQQVGHGQPASTPPLDEMRSAWKIITAEADHYLDLLTPDTMETFFIRNGKAVEESVGTMLLRNIFHYWYHIGEISSVRQMLGHPNLPEFVGDMTNAFYHREQ